MPGMPRANNKNKKIAYKILGTPENIKKASSYLDMPSEQDTSGADELLDIKRVIPRNYF